MVCLRSVTRSWGTLGFGALAAMALLAAPLGALAQDQPEAPPAGQVAEQAQEPAPEEVEEIVVTGTRIERKELEVAAPIAIYTIEDIQRTGVTSVGALLREIPSVHGGADTTQVNNGGGGTMRVSLRGLQSKRTLILMNGRRLPPNVDEGADGIAVDLNTIPVSMIERVEVLKDGASAIYGSDAVAGVVNIITRQYDGLEISAFYGDTHAGGERQELSLVTGGTGDTNWTFSAIYTDESEIEVADRHWARVPLSPVFGGPLFIGSSAPPWGNYAIDPDTEGFDCGEDGACTLGPEFGDEFREFSFFGGDSYNFAPANYQRIPNERWSVGLTADTKVDTISDLGILGDFTFYLEASFTNRESELKLAEVPLAPLAFFGTEAPYSADNIYNPFGQEIDDWRRRMVEGGSRFDTADEDTFRVLLGARGEWDTGPMAGWRWDASYIRGESEREQHFGDVYNLLRVAEAVGPTFIDEASGEPRCGTSPETEIVGCVPLNVFGQGTVTGDMLNYITFTTNESFEAEQDVFELVVSKGDLFELPAGPVGLAFGYQFREDSAKDTPDSQVAALGDAATGTPRQPTGGRIRVSEFFGEVVIPLLADVPLFQTLELEAAVRTSDYNTFGHTTNPKYGLRWRPFEDLLLRGTFSEAFRAPNVGELFGGGGVSFPDLSDPCSVGRLGDDGILGTEDDTVCLDPRVPDEGFDPISSQVRERRGGRSSLRPEEAKIYTIGLVYTPAWADGLSFAVDMYDYDLDDAITRVGSDFILASCAARGENCDKIRRFGFGGVPGEEGDRSFANVFDIDNRTDNVGGVQTWGFDFALGYRGMEAPFGGALDFRIDATNVQEYDLIQADGSRIHHAGHFWDDQDGYFARWKGTFGVDYYTERFRFSWDTRFIEGVEELAADLAIDPFTRHVSSRNYHDVQVAYDFDLGGISNTLQLGMDNIFSKDPPLSLSGFNDNTDVRTFDTVGRFGYARITSRF